MRFYDGQHNTKGEVDIFVCTCVLVVYASPISQCRVELGPVIEQQVGRGGPGSERTIGHYTQDVLYNNRNIT